MSHTHSHENTVPRPTIIAAGALVVVSLLMTAAVRVGVLEQQAVPPVERAKAAVAPVEIRDLTFADDPDGAVIITDAVVNETVAVIAGDARQSGFIRGVMRGLARDRHMRGIDAQPPFRLTLWQDGSLSLTDLATDRSIELGGFGPDNREAFLGLLEARTGA